MHYQILDRQLRPLKFEAGDGRQSGFGHVFDAIEKNTARGDLEAIIRFEVVTFWQGQDFGERVVAGKLALDKIVQLLVKQILDPLAFVQPHVGNLRHRLRELEDGRIERLRLGLHVQRAVFFAHLILGKDALEDALFVGRVHVERVGQSHESHAVIADPNLAVAVVGLVEEDVYHVPVFVIERGHQLEDARSFLAQADTMIEL